MDSKNFDERVRFLSSGSSRRGAIAGFSNGLLALAPAFLVVSKVDAKRKRRKRPKRQPSCRESCGPNCLACFNRPDNAPLCGDGYQVLCVECASDNDCVGSPQPYCIVDRTERATGERRRWTTNGCAEYPIGICAKVLGCNEI